jgi:23S rRNA pseudouridine1911/1915/1917 synthase
MKLTVETPETLLAYLETKMGSASRTRVRKLIKHGGVTVNGKVVTHPETPLAPGQVIEVRHIKSTDKIDAPFKILYDDLYLVAVDKPAGILSISPDLEDLDTVYRWMYAFVLETTNKRGRVHIVHRLDRDVSGVLLLAKTLEVKKALEAQWSQMDKRYYAIVQGVPPKPSGTVQSYLVEGNNTFVHSTKRPGEGKLAITHYQVLQRFARHSLLEVILETGRKNQIRVHMQELGCPIVGDRKYGASDMSLKRIGLHAFRMEMPHPVTKEPLIIESPMPAEFNRFLKNAPRLA